MVHQSQELCYAIFLALFGASSSTNDVMLRTDCDVGSDSSPSLLGTGFRLTAAPPAIDGLFGDDAGPASDMIVFRLGDVGIVGVPKACWLVLAVCRVSSDGELGMLRGAIDTAFSGTGGAGGEACCCCNCDSWYACLFVVDTTTGSLMTAVEKVSWLLEGLFTCRPLKKRRPKESLGLGDLLAVP